MLTGRPPFQSASMLETLEQVRSQEPVPPRRLRPSVPDDLQTICLKCLQKDPRRRYASAAALAEDLDRFLARRPILARPATLLEQAWKRARRRPTEAVLVSAIAATAVLGFTLVLWQWRRAETKAAAEAAANARAQQARRLSLEQQAELALQAGPRPLRRGGGEARPAVARPEPAARRRRRRPRASTAPSGSTSPHGRISCAGPGRAWDCGADRRAGLQPRRPVSGGSRRRRRGPHQRCTAAGPAVR